MKLPITIDKVDNNGVVGKAVFTFPNKIMLAAARFDNSANTPIANVTLVEVIKIMGGGNDGGKYTPKKTSVLWSLTGTELDEINKRNNLGDYVTDGYILKLIFSEMNAKRAEAQNSTDIRIGENETLRIEITTDATAPTWSCYADIDDVLRDVPWVRRVRGFNKTLAAGSDAAADNIPSGNIEDKFWNRLYVRKSAGTVIDLRIKAGAGKTEIFSRTKTVNDKIATDFGYTPGTYYDFVVDYSEDGIIQSPDLQRFKIGDQNVSVYVNNATPSTNRYILDSLSQDQNS